MSQETIEMRARRWTQPISDSRFGGEPARHCDAYQNLLVQIGHLDSLHADQCSWEAVYEHADGLLQNKTKDMTLLGTLCVALLFIEGVEALAAAMRAYRTLFEQHSQDMFPLPKRKRGRAGAYSWLISQLERALQQREPSAADHAALKSCLDDFDLLDELVRQETGTLHPATGRIKRELAEGVERTAPEPEPEPAANPSATAVPSGPVDIFGYPVDEQATAPEPASSAPAQPAPAAAAHVPQAASESAPAAPAVPVTIDSEKTATAAIERIAEELRRVARYYLGQDASQPVGHQLAQMASFVGLAPGGARAPRGLSPRQLGDLKDAVEQQRHADALKMLPELLDADLNLNALFQLARALEGLGQSHAAALSCVVGGALGLYLQFDGLADGSAETIQWLEQLRRPPEPVAKESEEEAPAQPAQPDLSEQLEQQAHEVAAQETRLAELVAAAEQSAAQEGIGSACVVLQEAISTTASPPARFRLRLALAELCTQHQAPEIASPLLQELFRELSQPVQEWDLALVTDLASAILECNRQLDAKGEGPNAEREAESSKMRGVLARIDPERALRERA